MINITNILYIFLDYLFNILININLKINEIKSYLYDNKIYNIRLLLEDNLIINYKGELTWNSITKYNKKVKCVEVKYYYKNQYYRIMFKYPSPIIFPIISNYASRSKFLYSNKYNELLKQYSGPCSDFYNTIKFYQNYEYFKKFNNIQDENIIITTNRLVNINIGNMENIII